MDEDDKMVLFFIGSIAVVFIGILIYNSMKNNGNPTPPEPTITEPVSVPSYANPTAYYQTAPVQSLSAPAYNPIPSRLDAAIPIAQNSENITWTDWKGRTRTITISRMVH